MFAWFVDGVDVDEHPALKGVDTEAAEQIFHVEVAICRRHGCCSKSFLGEQKYIHARPKLALRFWF